MLKTRLSKFYWVTLACLVGLTGLFALEGAYFGIGMLTFGLGIIVGLLAVNLLMLALSFLPAALAPRMLRWPAVALSLALYTAYLFLPGYLAGHQAKAFMAEQSAQDTAPTTTPPQLRRFELHYATQPSNDLCPEACDALLLSGDADWVRVIFANGLAATFTAADDQVRAARTTQEPADATLTHTVLTRKKLPAQFPQSWAYQPVEYERFEMRTAPAPAPPLFRKTYTKLIVISAPTFIFPSSDGMNSEGYQLDQTRLRGTKTSHLDILRSLGLARKTARPGPAPQTGSPGASSGPSSSMGTTDRALVTFALETTGLTLPKPEQRLLANYVIKANTLTPLPAEDLSLLADIIREPRFDTRSPLLKILEKEPKLRQQILPWVFDQLEQSGRFQSNEINKTLFAALRRIYPPEELNPYLSRYAALVEAQKPVSKDLARVLGRFGTDPSPVFRAMIEPTKAGLETGRHALCGAPVAQHPLMAPDLMAAFTRYIEQGGKLNRADNFVPYILSAYGYRAELTQLTRNQEPADSIYWQRLEKYEADPGQLFNLYIGACKYRL